MSAGLILPPAMEAPAWTEEAPQVDLGALVAFDIADSCRRLGLGCAARVAIAATTAAEWMDVVVDLRRPMRTDDRDTERRAALAAANRMARGDEGTAAGIMAALRSGECDPSAYVANVTAEMAAAKVSQ